MSTPTTPRQPTARRAVPVTDEVHADLCACNCAKVRGVHPAGQCARLSGGAR